MASAPQITLTPDELAALTGYKAPSRQLAELHRQGFWRARRSVLGSVILERAHYEAVSRGADSKPAADAPRPRLRLA